MFLSEALVGLVGAVDEEDEVGAARRWSANERSEDNEHKQRRTKNDHK
jgi:hypothetical protein